MGATHAIRRTIKRGLALGGGRAPARGVTILTYHRIGGGSGDELDLPLVAFEEHVEVLQEYRVVSLDTALDELDAGDESSKVVITFDDGFSEVHAHAWPLLREAGMPFTIYVATAHVGRPMSWEGGTGSAGGVGMTWDDYRELVDSGLVTVGNHTHSHARPDALVEDELDTCTALIREHVGVEARHFAYPWGIVVPAMEPALRERFRSVVTGTVGRCNSGSDPTRLPRVPVRASDPIDFFRAKLGGSLGPERAYELVVAGAKRVGLR